MSLLRKMATEREPAGDVAIRYDQDRQIALVRTDGKWVASWASRAVLETKKADIETGEDQKGH